MNDITEIAATSSTRARNGTGACVGTDSAIVHPLFAQPASL
ncbi:hypothetical protein VB151_14710 [Xanthomonas fragariae]|nr:hypothetical protein [Xanthomonas fragariae]MDM7573343.1 hypothetical protein [Xanthomonas fragariae]MDM7582626.1 hypothetical protein [Xanthomonas fragariae]MEA5174878.1 hypothetical protein [Xanthomonas fragariae]MEA5187575.1 hypothetical protein [Xanthomonas fragariae]MEA5199488.1 hypothetical protein [Xanthomonas fragariae]